MITNPYCTKVNLPSILADEEILHRSETTPYEVSVNDINQEVVELLSSRGLGIDSVEVFKLGKNNRRWVIHTDGYPEWFEGQLHGDMAKINWIYGNLDCEMKWYREHQNITKEIRYNDIGPYAIYRDEDVEEVFSANIGKSAIIQSAIPHTVFNNLDADRYCVSIHLKYPGFGRVPYTIVAHLLQDFII
jgi:hypothetical protein